MPGVEEKKSRRRTNSITLQTTVMTRSCRNSRTNDQSNEMGQKVPRTGSGVEPLLRGGDSANYGKEKMLARPAPNPKPPSMTLLTTDDDDDDLVKSGYAQMNVVV